MKCLLYANNCTGCQSIHKNLKRSMAGFHTTGKNNKVRFFIITRPFILCSSFIYINNYLIIKIHVFKAWFFSTPSRLVTGDPDFRVFLIAQLPLSPLLTRKRVFVLLQASFVLQLVF